jgi:hypothetical protein
MKSDTTEEDSTEKAAKPATDEPESAAEAASETPAGASEVERGCYWF